LPKWAAILLVIALAAGGSFAVFEFLLPSRIPRELVGRWRVDGGQMNGTIFEFQRNGTMIGRKTQGDKEGRIEGTAIVTDKTLRTTTTNPFTGKAETGAQTIITLTAKEFVTEDQKGARVTMRRVEHEAALPGSSNSARKKEKCPVWDGHSCPCDCGTDRNVRPTGKLTQRGRYRTPRPTPAILPAPSESLYGEPSGCAQVAFPSIHHAPRPDDTH
jgi:uncharacterized protein (TIGR03066 family)